MEGYSRIGHGGAPGVRVDAAFRLCPFESPSDPLEIGP